MTKRTAQTISALTAATLMTVPMMAHANGDIIGIVETGKGRVANAVVSLTEVPGTFKPSGKAHMDQTDKEFVPKVLAILKGTTVRFVNSDPFFHNVFSSSPVKTFNVSEEKKGDVSEVTFDKLGVVPVKCHIHGNMKGYIVVLKNPYFDVTNSKGLFKIANVPAGTYTLKVWGEKINGDTKSIEVPASGPAKVIFKVTD